jgi:hypothetical protein
MFNLRSEWEKVGCRPPGPVYGVYFAPHIFIAPSHPHAEVTKLLCPHHEGAHNMTLRSEQTER